uniref:Uncharacterized protein n=1 Tax=Romanomermis culicivorax TaxID=13658 RepID=A0A915HNL6_ROMCU
MAKTLQSFLRKPSTFALIVRYVVLSTARTEIPIESFYNRPPRNADGHFEADTGAVRVADNSKPRFPPRWCKQIYLKPPINALCKAACSSKLANWAAMSGELMSTVSSSCLSFLGPALAMAFNFDKYNIVIAFQRLLNFYAHQRIEAQIAQIGVGVQLTGVVDAQNVGYGVDDVAVRRTGFRLRFAFDEARNERVIHAQK